MTPVARRRARGIGRLVLAAGAALLGACLAPHAHPPPYRNVKLAEFLAYAAGQVGPCEGPITLRYDGRRDDYGDGSSVPFLESWTVSACEQTLRLSLSCSSSRLSDQHCVDRDIVKRLPPKPAALSFLLAAALRTAERVACPPLPEEQAAILTDWGRGFYIQSAGPLRADAIEGRFLLGKCSIEKELHLACDDAQRCEERPPG